MSTYRQFIFQAYAFDHERKTLTLTYGFDDELTFSETFVFDFDFTSFDETALDRACQNLFFMAGVSYFKAYLPPEIVIKQGQMDAAHAAFFGRTYQKGLGEFFYVNQLDPNTPITFPANCDLLPVAEMPRNSGQLVGIGGGKDSLVSVELLRTRTQTATWSVGHRNQLAPLIERIGLPHYWVERTWDKQLLSLNQQGAYNGHIPISAILACTGTIVAILSGHRDIVVSNEASADEPNLAYQGHDINHQYSKSSVFEADYQQLLQADFSDSLRYYSLLRPYSELRISELFAQTAFEKYKDVFSSCNRAFTHGQHQLFWCGECPKCAFVFLALTPFLERPAIGELFGKNLLLDPQLETTYRQLLGIEGDKPLECVGEVKESRAAMREAQKLYPELSKYTFDLPEDYDFRHTGPHLIPDDVATVLPGGEQPE